VGTPQVELPALKVAVYEVVEIHSVGPVHAGVADSVKVALGATAVATVADVQVLVASEKVKVKDHDGSGEARAAAAKRKGAARKAFILIFVRETGACLGRPRVSD